MRQKVILTAAVNGASLRKAQNSAVPEQPAEIGRDAEACWNAGAAVVHYHIRDQEGAPCCSPRILSEINDQVAARCPIITQASTAPLRAVEESLELFQAPHLPEMMTMAFGLMHLCTPDKQVLYPCTRPFLHHFLQEMVTRGVKPELEILNGASADDALALVGQADCLTAPLSATLLMGQPMQGIRAFDVDYLLHTLRRFPPGSQLSAACAGPRNLEAMTFTLLMGGNARVGMEETPFYQEGQPAKSNAQLVERAVRIIHELGLEVASPEEARTLLDMPHPSERGV